MKPALGCLGFILGIACALVTFFGFTYLNSRANLPLLPAAQQAEADTTVTLSRKYVTQQWQADLAQRGLGTSDLVLQLQPPNRATATLGMPVKLLGQTLDVRPSVMLHFGASNGAVSLTVDRVELNGFAVPQQVVQATVGSLVSSAEEEINSSLERQLAGTSLHLIDVECTDNALVIRFAGQPY